MASRPRHLWALPSKVKLGDLNFGACKERVDEGLGCGVAGKGDHRGRICLVQALCPSGLTVGCSPSLGRLAEAPSQQCEDSYQHTNGSR